MRDSTKRQHRHAAHEEQLKELKVQVESVDAVRNKHCKVAFAVR